MSTTSKYKLSFFNHSFSRNGQGFIWNTVSGALIKIDSAGLSFINRFKRGMLEPQDNGFFCLALKNGLIVRNEIDEVEEVLLKNNNRIRNEEPSSLTFVIAPGLGCNYSCNYCFESAFLSNSKMSPVVSDKTVEYIEEQLAGHPTVKRCSISWFGGEPLLYMDVIERISSQLIARCEYRGVKFSASMISNGRFLSAETIKRLKQYKIDRIQLSIDGTKSKYCKVKGASSADYLAVIENIVSAAENFRISVRINADCDDYEDAFILTRQLLEESKLNGKIRVYLAYVRRYSNSYEEDQMEQAKFDLAWMRYAEWFEHTYSTKSFAMSLPSSRSHVNCGLICRGNVCIGPEGEFYRCEHDFGDRKAVIGNVEDGVIKTDWYFDFEQPLPDMCAKCQMLPLCFGGCRHDLVHSHFRVNCASFTHRMESAMLLKYNKISKKVQRDKRRES